MPTDQERIEKLEKQVALLTKTLEDHLADYSELVDDFADL